jgi:hypothetical protein
MLFLMKKTKPAREISSPRKSNLNLTENLDSIISLQEIQKAENNKRHDRIAINKILTLGNYGRNDPVFSANKLQGEKRWGGISEFRDLKFSFKKPLRL